MASELKHNGEGRMPQKGESLIMSFSGYCRVGDNEEDLSSSLKDKELERASGKALSIAFSEDF